MSDELGTTIGATARAAREALGLTQAQVAERVGLVPLVYSRLERGKMLPAFRHSSESATPWTSPRMKRSGVP